MRHRQGAFRNDEPQIESSIVDHFCSCGWTCRPYWCRSLGAVSMKMVSGALLLVAAEQAYAHAKLVQFPNEDAAASVLMPASLVFLTLGTLLMIWGLLTESRSARTGT